MAKRGREKNPSESLGGSNKSARGRGRPRKILSSPVATPPSSQTEISSLGGSNKSVRGRGRPRKIVSSPVATPPSNQTEKSSLGGNNKSARRRGRPRKTVSSPVATPPSSRTKISSLGGSSKSARGRRRPRKIVSSPVATPPSAQTEISSSTRFLKIFFPDASTQNLRIPPAFCQQIDKKAINGTACLRGPSGHKWQVELMQRKNDLYFESGWRDFVFDHSIQVGEILVFRYEGQSSFSVQVFDCSACEKESAFSAQPSKSSKGCHGQSVLQEQPNMALVVVKKEEPDDFTDSRLLMLTKTPEQPSYKRWLSHNTDDRSWTEVTKRKRARTLVSQRRPVTQEEIDNTLERAKSFASENPFITVVMRKSHVYCSFFLALRADLRVNLPKSNAKLTLWDPTGRSWPIIYVRYGHHGALSGGWGKASVANNLEIHDVVVFELVKKNHMNMHIYRVVEEITPLIKHGCEVEHEHCDVEREH